MAIEQKTRITDLVSRVSVELGDTDHHRWSAETLAALINEALRRMADRGVFTRTDLHPVAAGQPLYQTLAESVTITRVLYEGRELEAVTSAELTRRFGGNWRSHTGTPRRYAPTPGGLALHPCPSADAAPLALPAETELDEADGGKIDGDGFAAAVDGDTVIHFRLGAQGSPSPSGQGVLAIEYGYHPRPSSLVDSVPTNLTDPLRRYLLFSCLATSEVPEEMRAAEGYRLLWEEALRHCSANSGEQARVDALRFAPMEAL